MIQTGPGSCCWKCGIPGALDSDFGSADPPIKMVIWEVVKMIVLPTLLVIVGYMTTVITIWDYCGTIIVITTWQYDYMGLV